MSKKWCIKCKTELNGGDSDLSIFGLGGSSTGLYCPNSECPREGLVTVLCLQEQTKAPKSAKPNKPEKKDAK